ncbi:hypothetical protein R1flu_012891 [Riccia fluitans]|uniref:TATA box binding protein associated factor (TAF) histone-like fold domain-containing protein n=1 Tax=Riccia fluitans TaxID=41844 RepID=A0ABD1ZED0_9MARC
MSVVGKDPIQTIAQFISISNLSDDVAAALAPDVEYRMRGIMQEAINCMRHFKRSVLTTDDVNSALSLRNVECLYGFAAGGPLRYRRVLGHADLYYIEDREMDFKEIIDPAIPENAPIDPITVPSEAKKADASGVSTYIPNIPPYLQLLAPELSIETQPNEMKRYEAWKVYGALKIAAGKWMYCNLKSHLPEFFSAPIKPSTKAGSKALTTFHESQPSVNDISSPLATSPSRKKFAALDVGNQLPRKKFAVDAAGAGVSSSLASAITESVEGESADLPGNVDLFGDFTMSTLGASSAAFTGALSTFPMSTFGLGLSQSEIPWTTHHPSEHIALDLDENQEEFNGPAELWFLDTNHVFLSGFSVVKSLLHINCGSVSDQTEMKISTAELPSPQ